MSVVTEKAVFLQPLIEGELSSAGLEHLPYKQRVTGSNPVAPTNLKNSDLMQIKLLFLLFGGTLCCGFDEPCRAAIL